MVKHCIAFGCTNRSAKDDCKGLSWHSLPLSNKKLLDQWLIKIKRVNTPVNKNSVLCSQHFEPECFIKPLGGQRMRLKPGSVPTKFSFTVGKTARKKPSYRSPIATTKKPKTPTVIVTNEMESEISDDNRYFEDESQSVQNDSIDESHISLDDDKDLLHELQLKEAEIDKLLEQQKLKEEKLNSKIRELEQKLEEEVNARKELEMLHSKGKFSIETVKDNDKLIKFYTSFCNYSEFSMVLDFLGRDAASNLDYRNLEKSPGDQSKNYKYKPGPNRQLTVENEFLMTLCRLKVGLLEDDISARFGVSQPVVSQIINTWVKFMFYTFKELEIFPPQEITKLHLPECFVKKYPSTTLIIDATEIYIEKPSNPEAQQLTFSSYKNTNTLKALIGIVPKGSISFVSTLYGGSISDKELTIRSGLLDKVQRGDAVMADRGFNIQDILAPKGVRVNIPPFMNPTGQFDEKELLETRRIATLRIHVERAMERIKNFHILDFIPITLCRGGMIDMIFFVCAMLSNFQLPLVDN